MPLTNGVLWQKSGAKFEKKVTMSGVSKGQVEYLSWLQLSSLVVNDAGERATVHHAYFQGEKLIAGYPVDGYFELGNRKVAIEYEG